MRTGIIETLNNKRILIFGYGREGKSTEQYIKAHCDVKCLDVFEGKPDEIDEDKYDLIIKSPGIVMLTQSSKYTSQTELFLNEFSSQTIGITGTKGKSTTAAMLEHALSFCGKKALLLGNIGKPCFDMIDEIDDDTIIVFELSCHQLVKIGNAPHISVFLNLYEEHLDYYGTMENYFAAKSNIVTHQKHGDCALLGENVPEIGADAEKIVISKPHTDYNLNVPGEHNKLNAEFVFYIANHIFNLDEKNVIAGIEDFKGLPHRLEYFGTFDGIKFYDDSISTIPQALISAAKSVPDVKTIIAGGMDRGIDYSELVSFIKNTPDIFFILCYATGLRIMNELTGDTNPAPNNNSNPNPDSIANINSKDIDNKNINKNNSMTSAESSINPHNFEYVQDLTKAVNLAKKVTKKGGAVVLSPAAPSYGYFKDFEERGEHFKELCKL